MKKVCIVGASRKLGKYMVHALEDEALVREAPAVVGCKTPSALAHIR